MKKETIKKGMDLINRIAELTRALSNVSETDDQGLAKVFLGKIMTSEEYLQPICLKITKLFRPIAIKAITAELEKAKAELEKL